MKVMVDGVAYRTIYHPFFRIANHEENESGDFEVYGLRYPSGAIEELLVFDPKNRSEELREHLAFLLKEYALEDDDLLSSRAKELKRDVKNLFGIN